MSGRATTWALEQRVGDAHAKIVLLTLADSANKDTNASTLSIKSLARSAEISVRTVQTCLGKLEAKGYLRRNFRKTEKGDFTSTEYILNLDGDSGVVSDSHHPSRKSRTTGGAASLHHQDEPRVSEPSKRGSETNVSAQSAQEELFSQTQPQVEPPQEAIRAEPVGATAGKPDCLDFGDAVPLNEDPRAKLWREGVTSLVALGVREVQARAVIGRWLRQTNDDCIGVAAAIAYAYAKAAIDPIAYVSATITARGGYGPRRRQRASEALAELADRLEQAERDGTLRPDATFRSH